LQCVSRNRKKTPSIAVVDPSPAATIEEDSMATPDQEELHHMEALRKPQKTPDIKAGMKTSMEEHRLGTHPELLQPWIDARRRLTPRDDRARSTLQPTASPVTAGVPLTKRTADTTTIKATESKAARTPIEEPVKPDSTSTRLSPTPE
jgi:hypothetical protein